MLLVSIVLATLAAGIGSVWLAAIFSFAMLGKYADNLLSLAAGALLATALMHLLPEAFESQASAHDLFTTLLAGIVVFFLLDKAELWHHGHEHKSEPEHPHSHEDGAHHHVHAAEKHPHAAGGWTVLAGDSVHCFGDGILIAAAFMSDMRLGFIAALAVLVHEVPHHMGDLVVLRQSSSSKKAAFLKVSLAGIVTTVGGLAGYFLVDWLQDWQPFFLVVASSSFIYVALADLIPQLQKRFTAKQTASQIFWIFLGGGLVTLVSGLAHAH